MTTTKCPKCGAEEVAAHTKLLTQFACGSRLLDDGFVSRNTGFAKFDQSKDCELSTLRAKLDLAKTALNGCEDFSLKRINDRMEFATRVVMSEDSDWGKTYKFLDRTGHLHGEFRVFDAVSPAPENVAGVTRYDGWWFWVIRPATLLTTLE
jgi:hypothetical protein